MNYNPRVEFWDDLLNTFFNEHGSKITIELFKSGKIFLKDLNDSHVSFICESGKDRKIYTKNYNFLIANILKKVKPSLKSWEVKCHKIKNNTTFMI